MSASRRAAFKAQRRTTQTSNVVMYQTSHSRNRRTLGEDFIELVQRFMKTFTTRVNFEARMDVKEYRNERRREEFDDGFELIHTASQVQVSELSLGMAKRD